MKYQVKIRSNGDLEFLPKIPPGLNLPNARRNRFSEIVPDSLVRRIAFRILRALFGESGQVSERTRQWQGKWRCVILRGNYKGTTRYSRNRAELIDWEQGIWKISKPEVHTEVEVIQHGPL